MLKYLMFSFFPFSILVTCKPCSDEEVLMAVCTSDFGKYIHTNTHVSIEGVVLRFGKDEKIDTTLASVR